MKYYYAALVFLLPAALSNAARCVGERDRKPFVLGGNSAREGQFPFIAYFLYSPTDVLTDNVSLCTASLIRSDWVIMAAHCDLPSTRYAVVAAGRSDLSKYLIWRYQNPLSIPEPGLYGVQERTVVKVVKHPSYNSETYVNDLALMKVVSFTLGEHTNIINISPRKMETMFCTIVGWGSTSEEVGGVDQPYLMFANNIEATPASQGGCPITGDGSKICLHVTPEQGICGGDSGGPLVCEGLLWGVASVTVTASNYEPQHTYIELWPYLYWIEQEMMDPGLGDGGGGGATFTASYILTIACLLVYRQVQVNGC